jgi:nitrate/nitrite transporter NarK
VGLGGAVCFAAGADLARSSGTGPTGIGIFGGVAIAAGGAAVLVVPLLDGLLGWRSAWATAAATAAVALVSVLFVSPARSAGARPPAPAAGHASVLRDRELHRLAGVHAMTLGLSVVLGNWVAVVLERSWELGGGISAVLGSLVLLLAVVSRPLGGYLARRHPDRTRAMVVGSLVAAAAATAALAQPSGVLVAAVAVGVLGIASGLPFAATLATVQMRRPDRPAASVGLLNGQANVMVLVGAPLLGLAIQNAHSVVAMLVAAGVWLLPLLFLPTSFGTRSSRAG